MIVRHFWLRTEGSKLLEITGFNPEGYFPSSQTWVECPEDLNDVIQNGFRLIEDYFEASNGTIVESFSGSANYLRMASVRHKRNNLLQDSDWTQTPEFTGTNSSDWLAYRQELRDIPQAYTTPKEVVWPTKPKDFQIAHQ